MGNPDAGFNSSYEEYVLFSGLQGDVMLGEYSVVATGVPENAWTLTATVAGEVVWVEQGVLHYEQHSDNSHSSYYSDTDTTDDDGDDYKDSSSTITSRRRLYSTMDD